MDDRKYSIDKIGPRIEGLLRAFLDRAGFELKFGIHEGRNPHPDIENPEVVVKFLLPEAIFVLPLVSAARPAGFAFHVRRTSCALPELGVWMKANCAPVV